MARTLIKPNHILHCHEIIGCHCQCGSPLWHSRYTDYLADQLAPVNSLSCWQFYGADRSNAFIKLLKSLFYSAKETLNSETERCRMRSRRICAECTF